uniref:C2H2-type domain-containing protein n=1 Tax=Bursaphelenchus xylophilus TaxID=6326 RepID=A0A1I7S7Q0_BURXY
MPPCPKSHLSSLNGTVRPTTIKKKYSEFEELAFRTVQALNPHRKIHRKDVKIDQVKEVIRRVYYGEAICPLDRPLPSPGSVSSTASTSSSSTLRHESLDGSDNSLRKSGRKACPKRVLSPTDTSEHSYDNLSELILKSLDEPDSLASFRRIKTECRKRACKFRGTGVNNSIYEFVNSDTLKNEIDSNISSEKNIQLCEVNALLELYKMELNLEVIDDVKVIAKLRFLNVLTSDSCFKEFVMNTLDKAFGKTLPDQLRSIRVRFGIDMPPNESISFKKSPSPRENVIFKDSRILTKDRTSKSPVKEAISDTENDELNGDLEQKVCVKENLRKRTRKSTSSESVEDEVAEKATPRSPKRVKQDVEDGVEVQTRPKRHVEEKEKAKKKPEPVKVESKGSIASRRQTMRRLCVISRSTGLIQPTARRSSTASFIQKQQTEMVTLSRKRYSITDIFKAPALPKAETPKKTNVQVKNKVEETVETKKPAKKQTKNILDQKTLSRYEERMTQVFEKSKNVTHNEVFYGRCNIRQGLFEETESENSTSKQKNRSGRSTKAHLADCLYFAHTLLNVHNPDPLASGLPKAIRCPSNPKIVKIKKLVRHASRSRVLKYNKYLQRCKLQQLAQEAREKAEFQS